MASFRRRNGCSRPFHPLQVASWVLFPLFAVSYATLFVPYFAYEPAIWIPLAFAYFLFAIVTGASAVSATLYNPQDHNLANPALAKQSSPENRPADRKYCWGCEHQVQKPSLHCPVCNKCIHGYDHHCIWLNNCIGEGNYRRFLVLLVSTSLLLTTQASAGVFIIVKWALDSDAAERRIEFLYDDFDSTTFGVLVIVFTVLVLAVLLPLLQLLYFHIMLVRRGLTTYEFLMGHAPARRQRQEQAAPAPTPAPSVEMSVAFEGAKANQPASTDGDLPVSV